MKSHDPIAALPLPASSEDLFSRSARSLTRFAARRSPPALAERLEEEWLADLAVRGGVLAQLRFALGCCWASRVIAQDPLAFGATAVVASGGHGSTAAFGSRDPSFFSRRTAVFILIVGVHVAAIYGFASGFVKVFTVVLPHSSKGVVLDPPVVDVQPLMPPRYVPTYVPVRPVPQVPNFDLSPPVITHAEESVAGPASNAVPEAASREITRVIGGPGSGFPNTRDFYPAASLRAEEAGVAAVRVCVDRNGRLTSDPVIVESSGSRRLDGGALALARAGSGHYRSTMENGASVTDCYPFRIRFELQSLH
jgi:TonB family protein